LALEIFIVVQYSKPALCTKHISVSGQYIKIKPIVKRCGEIVSSLRLFLLCLLYCTNTIGAAIFLRQQASMMNIKKILEVLLA
jgi:hypothetical protein